MKNRAGGIFFLGHEIIDSKWQFSKSSMIYWYDWCVPWSKHGCCWHAAHSTNILSLRLEKFNIKFVTLTRAASQPVALLFPHWEMVINPLVGILHTHCDIDKTFFWIQSTPPFFWNQNKPKATPGTSTFWRLSLAWLRWWWCCWPNGQRRWPPLINAGCPAWIWFCWDVATAMSGFNFNFFLGLQDLTVLRASDSAWFCPRCGDPFSGPSPSVPRLSPWPTLSLRPASATRAPWPFWSWRTSGDFCWSLGENPPKCVGTAEVHK